MLGTLGAEVRTIRRFVLTILLGGFGLAAGLLALAPQAKAVLGAGHAGRATAWPSSSELAQRSVVRARDGSVLAVLHDEENRSPVPLSEVPEHTIKAVLDGRGRPLLRPRRRRPAVDAPGAGHQRVGRRRARGRLDDHAAAGEEPHAHARPPGRPQGQGGGAGLAPRGRPCRSARSSRSYLNTVYFGNGAYGVQAAAETYFNKDVGDLTVAESAFLAGVIRNPVGYDPIKFPEAARARRNEAVDRMLAERDRHRRDGRRAIKADAAARPRSARRCRKPNDHFVEAVKQRLLEGHPPGRDAAGAVQRRVPRRPRHLHHPRPAAERSWPRRRSTRSSRTPAASSPPRWPRSSRRTGAVRALVGGRDFNTSEVNLALGREGGGTGRQPGSSFKPFVLVAALEDGFGPNDAVDGTSPCPIKIPGHKPWEPENYEGEGGGVMTIADATAQSVNCAYVRMAARGRPRRRSPTSAQRMGITSPLEPLRAVDVARRQGGVAAGDGRRPTPRWPPTASTTSRTSSSGSSTATARSCSPSATGASGRSAPQNAARRGAGPARCRAERHRRAGRTHAAARCSARPARRRTTATRGSSAARRSS